MYFNGFRIEDYKHICKTIYNSKYKTYTLREYFEQKPVKDFIILRHDVDYNIYDALKIAEIEFSFGIKSSYFIRINNKATKKNISLLNDKVSEIGLHYDALAKTNNNISKALTIFRDQLNYLNSVVEVNTISAHGSSTKNIRNTKLLETINMDQFNIIGDAMASIDFEKIPYYSDAGRTWNLQKNKLSDFPEKLISGYKYSDSSNELCSLIAKEYYDAIYLSSHPELWAKGWFYNIFKEFKYGRMRFLLKSFIKQLSSATLHNHRQQ